MAEEYLTYRFGIVAVKKGFVTPDQVVRALESQVEENLSQNIHKLIGEIFVDKGLMTVEQVDEVVKDMSV
jgi:hypothetical protein